MGKYIGYIRISTDKQNLELQEDSLKTAGCYKIFQDIASGTKSDRPGLSECLNYIREGDTLVVWDTNQQAWRSFRFANVTNVTTTGGENIPAT